MSLLPRTFEWFRIVDPKPEETYLENRSKSVESYYAKLIASTSTHDVAEAAAIIIGGPTAKTPFTDAVIKEIQANQGAFPSDWNESKLELRTFAGLTLETLLSSKDVNVWRKQIAASSVFQTGLLLRKSTGKTYLEKETAHLLTLAMGILSKNSRSLHFRKDTIPEILSTPLKEEDEIDFALIDKLREGFRSSLAQLQQQAKLDQEELNILWWLYGAYSDTAGVKYSDLDVWAAAYSAGFEVAALSLAPPIVGLLDIVTRGVESGRKPVDLKKAKLTKIATSWKEPVNLEVMSATANDVKTIQDFPALFPLSWLVVKLHEVGPGSDWQAPFEIATGVSSEIELKPGQLAHQIFRERTAQRYFPS